jgi:hypothetical protein
MSYIVIEVFEGTEYATICMDEKGNNLVFHKKEEAEKEAGDCQEGLILEI